MSLEAFDEQKSHPGFRMQKFDILGWRHFKKMNNDITNDGVRKNNNYYYYHYIYQITKNFVGLGKIFPDTSTWALTFMVSSNVEST